jgi:hypothetical protein
MSGAHIDFIDRAKRVLWLSYDGQGDQLEANLRAYGVEYVPDFRHGRVGISFTQSCPETEGARGLLSDSTEDLLQILTTRSGITIAMEKKFFCALTVVQEHQRDRVEASSW